MVNETEGGGGGWVEAIIDRAIEADMTWQGFAGDVRQGFWVDWWPGPRYNISPPSGPNRDGHVEFTDAHGVMDDDEVRFDVVGQVYTYWQNLIRAVWAEWDDIPTAGDFDGLVSCAEETMFRLAAPGPTPGADDGAAVGNSRLSKMESIKIKIGLFGGDTMIHFLDKVAVPLPDKVSAQHCVATMLGTIAYSEQQLWKDTPLDLAEIGQKAHDAMALAKRGGGEGGDLNVVFKVAASVATAATLFVSGGTGAAVVGAGAKGLGILNQWLPKGDKERSSTYSGQKPIDVYYEMAGMLGTLKVEIADQERELSRSALGALGTIEERLGAFTLMPKRNPLGDVTDDRQVLTYDDETITTVAGRWMPIVSSELDQAAAQAQGLFSSGPWYRSAAIAEGLPTGAYEQFADLAHKLVALVERTSTQVSLSAELLVIAVNELNRVNVDAAVRMKAQEIAIG